MAEPAAPSAALPPAGDPLVASAAGAQTVTVISADGGALFPSPRELYAFRELFYRLVWRDVTLRYSNTLLGVAWVLLQPISQMLVLTMVFGFFARIPTGDVPYAIFVFAGLVPYQYFSKVAAEGAASLTGNINLVKKIYFPRLLVPLAPVVSALLDLAVMTAFLLLLMTLVYDLPLLPQVLCLPLVAVVLALLGLGVGLWFSALSVRYRDASLLLPTILSFLLYLSPVIYPASLVPAQWLWLYSLNPMVGVVEGFRWALFGSEVFGASMLVVPVLAGLALVTSGTAYFRRVERIIPDVM